MAEIRVYIQPRLPAAANQTAFYDFSKHIEFDSLEWEQNDQGNASTLRANIYYIMPASTTHWSAYAGATEALKIQAALNDPFFHLRIYPRTEVQIRDVSTSPHTILWGGVITRVSEQRDGGAVVGSIDAIDYTALLNEAVALEFTPLANSTIKNTITSQTYSFTPSSAKRSAGLSTVTVASINIGAPYNRTLEIGDTIVVNLSDDTYDGVHKVTGVTAEGSTYQVRFQQYSSSSNAYANLPDSASASVTGTVVIPGFMTQANAPQIDSRIVVSDANIADLNPNWKWSPRNPDIVRNISNVSRDGTTATVTTSAQHGFGVDRVVSVSLTNGPSGYANLNGSFVIVSVPTDSTFTYTTVTSGTITSGAATGTSTCSGEITPTPMKGGTLSRNLQYAVEKGNGSFYLGGGTLDGSGNLSIPLNVKSLTLSDLIANGLFDSNKSVVVSSIKSSASTTKTITTAYPHGIYTGYVVTISGAVGANAADVNGNSYAVTVTSTTSFTITAATSNSLNLTGGSIAVAAYSGWSLASYSLDTAGTTGPFGVGNSVYYTGSDHQDMELASTNRIIVTAGEKYFISWRQKSEKVNKSHLHVKFYNSSGVAVGNSHGYDICKADIPNSEWGRNYGIAIVPATAVSMTPVLHHDSFSSSYSVYYTDIQAIKLTGSFGFSDRPLEDNAWYNSINGTGVDLRDFENPNAPEESGESANRIYVYAPYTTEDPLTGAKMLTSYRNTYDFVQGVWGAGGKRVEGSVVELKATDSTTALLTAQQYFKDKGQSLKSYEFEHISGKLNIGDVVPFIWNELGVAEALIVRRQVGYLIGQDVYYRVQLGGDMSFQRSTMYLVERRLREISGDSAYFSPPPSPYPGTPTEGGIVSPAVPSATAGQKQAELSWQYPQKIVSSSAFGGFLVLRGPASEVGGGTSNVTGDGTNATITTNSAHGLVAGNEIVLKDVVPEEYNGGYAVVSAPTSTTFTVKNSTTTAQTTAGSVYKVSEWYKSSTSEKIAAAKTPLAPESAVPSYTDTNLTAGQTVAYKVAAIDVSGPTPILSGYSQVSEVVTPTDVSISFDNAYSGLGINVPKIINSVTYDNVSVTKPISGISRTGGSFIATVTTSEAHGFTGGMPVGISNTSNDAAIRGFYSILGSPAPTTTTFSITTLSDSALSITGGTSNGYGDATARTNLSGNFSDDNGTSRVLGDAWSTTQFPVGQIAFSQADGKLYRNGLPGTSAFDGLWIRAALDAIDVSPDGTIRISADRITTGTIDAGIVNVTNLNATNLQTGKIVIDNAWGTNAGSATVLYRSKASSVATLWTSTEHGFSNADSVYVHIGDTAYDGVKTITATNVAVARQARLVSTAGISLSEAHNILTGQSITTTGLSANLTGTFTVSAIAASVTHASRVGTVAAVRTSQPHAFTTSDTVTVTGVNSNFNVSNVSISGITPALAFRQQGTPVSASATSTVATLRTSNPHGFIVGDSVVVSGSGVTAWNTTQTVTSITSPISDYQRIGTAVTLRTSQYHGIQNSDSIIVSGLGSPYDGTFTVSATNGTTASLIRSQRLLTNAVIATAGPHGFKVGDSVVVSGLAAAYNGTYAVTATSVAITSKAQAATLATLTTTVPHGFINGDTVVVSGVGAPWDTTGAVISGVATTGNPTTFQYTVGTSATVTTTAATGSADNGKRFTYTLGSATTSIATTTGTGTSYGTISYTAGSGTGTVLLTAATGSPTVDNSKTFSFTATAGTVVPTSISGGTADSYQTFTYTSSSSGQIASSAITPNGSATTGKTIYFSTPSTSGTIVPASATGTVTNNRIIRYATSAGTAGLSSVVDGTVVKKTDVYAITSTNFSVDISGNIVASGASLTSATVSGEITATTGAIGGWVIDASSLTSGNVAINSSGTYAFSAGAGPEFTVTDAGAVTASDLTITGGSITIGSTFGVTSAGQLSAVGGYFDPTTGRPGIVVAGSTSEGDLAAASSGTLNLGYTSAGSSGTGTYKNVVSISSSGLWVYSTSNTVGGAIRSYTSDGGTFGEMVWNESAGRIEFGDPIFSASATFTGGVLASTLTATGNVISNGTGFLSDTPTTQTTPTTYTSGRAAIWTNTAGTAYRIDRYVAASSARAKKNIGDTNIAPEQFYGINLVDFEYDHDAARAIWPNLSEMPTSIQQGVIYEQVKEVMPEAVFDENSSGPGDPPGINWDKIYFAALVALQDMNDRVISLEARIAELES